MIKIEKVTESGAEAAIRGMRNPMNSWDKSDTLFNLDGTVYELGSNDRNLMLRLACAGPEHRKFMRMMTITADVTAPLYWWKEYDTYKVGTVVNSCSTMHKIHAKKFTMDDFSHEHLRDEYDMDTAMPHEGYHTLHTLEIIIKTLNNMRSRYIETNDKQYWWSMIQLLPSSYNQRRTILLNYEIMRNIFWQRNGHKLDEWKEFCTIMMSHLKFVSLILTKRGEEELSDDPIINEYCPECEHEVTFHWNTAKMGYKAFCPVCGKRLMLCDECQYRFGSECMGDCDYDSDTGTCRFNQKEVEQDATD